jgi:hypothetical protein
VYFHFGYKRLSATTGTAKGYILTDEGLLRKTNYNNEIIHYPITEYLYFAVGSTGASLINRYPNFNG